MRLKILFVSAFVSLSLGAGAQTMDWLVSPGQYSDVTYLGQNLFKVRDSGGKCGIIKSDGSVAIEVKYDSITPFVEDKALLVDKDGARLLGIISSNGEMVRDLSSSRFSVTRYPGYREGRLPFRSGSGLCGYLNERGEIAIEPNYYLAAPFQDGVAAVQYQGGDYGLINKGGKSAIVSNTEYSFVSSPVDGRVFAVSGTRKGGDALSLYRIEGAKLKKEKTYEEGMNIWLSDDFTTLECQKGSRYSIDNQWRIYDSNTGRPIPEIVPGPGPYKVETSKVLGKSNYEGGLRITYLGNPIVNNVFPDVATYDDYAIVRSKDGKVGVLKLNKSAAIDIKSPRGPVVFYHDAPADVLLDVDLKAVNPDKLHWYRNDTGYLTHSSLEFNNGRYQLRMPYYKPNVNPDQPVTEEIDIAFTYDGLDWMHHTLSLQSVHRNSDRFDVAVSGPGAVGANGRCTLSIEVRSLNGNARGIVRVRDHDSKRIDGESVVIPVTVAVPNNTSRTFTFTIEIEEDGCPVYTADVKKTVQGRKVKASEVKSSDEEILH